ncbi:MAG: flavodoxin [Clostridia bacterium]|nr:flavodoxin [Clostridia bacterium]
MTIAVRYHSRTGNTRKVADAIARALGCSALDMSQPLPEKADVLFLCNAMYAAGVDDAVKQFIAANASQIGALCNVCTTAIAPSTRKMVQKLASEHGVALLEEEFRCPGAFAIMHRSRPSADDLNAAAAFAKRIAGRAR